MSNIDNFINSIHDRKCVVGVVGMGYVGLPLVLEFCEKGFKVIGYDIDDNKINALNSGESYIKHIPASRIDSAVKKGLLSATTDFTKVSETDVILIAVPTPLTDHREPELSYITATANTIAPYVHKNQLIVLESTTYPGTTEEVLLPILEKGSGCKAGKDFWLAFSPEREDPNNPDYNTSTIPKVVGGYTPDCLRAATTLYGEIIVRTIPVSTCATAEATKLVENIFRGVNIAMVNELKMIFHKMGINVWEVINAAKTKPFGFMPFYPGPGLGGHCIPIDPFYLTWKALEFGVNTKFIELAGEINEYMPDYVIMRTMEEMNEIGKALKGSKLLLVGLAYKGDVDDMRESPSLVLFDKFTRKGADVSYYDPYIPVIPPSREHSHLTGIKSIELKDVSKFDLVVISTDHASVDHEIFAKNCELVMDTRNAIEKEHKNVKRA
ncbi:MAG: nucleotide sugar dehydrogenase [Calditrichaeota bacterium]|nr:nucleotide sugar dehydrogenase [Calditrichota bacterium]MBT7617374.1 nucleotide sugar dehydrogenase [Calditrichota bacterium]MBT7788074.1 nucleotide sugar dehydrogenase [Calditrichota bacterium]